MSFNNQYNYQPQFPQQQAFPPQQQPQQMAPGMGTPGGPGPGPGGMPQHNPYQGVQLQQQQQSHSPAPQMSPSQYAQQQGMAQGMYGNAYRPQPGGFNYPQQQSPMTPQQQQHPQQPPQKFPPQGMTPQRPQYPVQAQYQSPQLQAQQQQQAQLQRQQLAAQSNARMHQPQMAQQGMGSPMVQQRYQQQLRQHPGQQQTPPMPYQHHQVQPPAPAASPQVGNAAGPVSSAPLVGYQQPYPQMPLQAQQEAKAAEYSSSDTILKTVNELKPAETLEERGLIENVKKDAQYEKKLQKSSEKASLLKSKQAELDYINQTRAYRGAHAPLLFGEGYSGYGNDWTGKTAILQYPRDRKRAKRKAPEYVADENLQKVTAEIDESLCPVRLDFDADNKVRLRDTFTWNIKEPGISVEMFVQNLLEDFGIPDHNTKPLSQSIREQLDEFHPHAFTEVDPDIPGKDEDMRITIKLDITIGQHNLVDQFEWDMNCVDNSPEEFAEKMCQEMSLSGEFVTAIAHAIREQTQLHTRSLFLTGYPFDGSIIEEEDIRREICQTVSADDVLRHKQLVKEFSPVLFEIPDMELDRQDKDRERDSRRRRRQGRAGRRGGPQLPDLRESVRTFRTPVYNAILPGGVDKNLELLRKHAAMENSDDDDDDDEGGYTPNASRGRGRRAAHAAQAAIHGQIHYNNNPHSTLKTGSIPPTKQPLHRVAMQNNMSASPHGRDRSVSATPEEFGSMMVTLKVPRLREIMMSSGYT